MSDFIEMVMQVDTPDGHRNVNRAYIYGSIQNLDRDPPLMMSSQNVSGLNMVAVIEGMREVEDK